MVGGEMVGGELMHGLRGLWGYGQRRASEL